MFKEKVKNQPVAGENPKADPKAKQLCKKPAAADQLWKRRVAPDTGKPPLHYKVSIAFFDSVRKQWRVKSAGGLGDWGDWVMLGGWGDAKKAQEENWKKWSL